jgi:hypothetical protein
MVDLLNQRESDLSKEALLCNRGSVDLTNGPFAGIKAIYLTGDANRCSLILLEILAKRVLMHIGVGRLRKAD